MNLQANRPNVNRNNKATLFGCMMSEKKYIIDVYNALNNTDYSDDDESFEISTLEDVIYIHHKNDVSFIIDSRLALYEHQSTYNPNMPLRGLFYFAALYQNIIGADSQKIYGSKLLKIPTPKYVVFYNGVLNMPDRLILRLSDAYETDDEYDLEVTATMININCGRNTEILEKSQVLRTFSIYNEKVRCYTKSMKKEDAVARSIEECIEEGLMSDFFINRKLEVENVILTEFNEEGYAEMLREEGREEVIAQEQAKTEAERKRADEAEAEITRLQAELEALKRSIQNKE